MGKRRSFTPEFKQEAVRLSLESGRPISQVARELEVRPDQLRHWKQELSRGSAVGPPGGEPPEQELRRLRRELEVVRQERDFLKKAAAFFAKESR
jgi:transposase